MIRSILAPDRHAVYARTATLCAALEKLQSDATAAPEEKERRFRKYGGDLTKLAQSIRELHLSTNADLSVIALPASHAYIARNIKILRETMEIMQAEGV